MEKKNQNEKIDAFHTDDDVIVWTWDKIRYSTYDAEMNWREIYFGMKFDVTKINFGREVR